MRILVILGRVLDPRGIVVNPRAGRIFVNREEYILQPADRCALEAALRIKEAVEAEVVALPRTFLPDDDILRQALAIGADRAIYIAGEPAALPDDGRMARVLLAAIARLGGADLILTGATTLDTGQGQLGPRLAEALGWPQIVGAWTAEVADGNVRAVRQDGGGYVWVEAPMPAVVTFVPGALKLRYPDGRRLINIYKGLGEIAAALERWEAKDLVAPEALMPVLERRGQDFPPERERGVRLSGTLEEIARAAADALRARLPR
ncbi:MAG: electron transfer flavoprotein subunit beta/FixA family protein [Anaerolineae bacterium]